LLEGDYLDLFNRFMWGLKLADSSSKRTTKYNNDKIEHSDNSYIINIQKDISNFPYSVNEVNNYLKEIQNNVWNWKDKNSNLSSKTNSTLAEYFVNLKFCYLLNISPLDFRKFVNTKVSDELQPVFTASGGESDMLYKINNTIISIETTILKTPRAIINNERYPCIRLHIPIDEKTNKIILNFINFLGNDNEIRRMFDHDWELQFPNFNNKFLNIANFLELAERNKI
jgi:hypothetical protein